MAKRAVTIHVGVFMLVVLTDILFYGQPVGWTAGAYAVLATMILLWHRSGGMPGMAKRLVIAAILVLVAAAILDPTPLVKLLLFLAVMELRLVLRRGDMDAPFRESGAAICSLGTWFIGPMLDFFGVVERGVHLPALEKTCFRWALPWLGSALFLWLFGQSNLILARHAAWVWSSIHDTLDWLTIYITYGRAIFWGVSAWLAWSFLRSRGFLKMTPRAANEFHDRARLSAGLTIRCLFLFTLWFLLPLGMDAYYLWWKAELPQGVTYAEYAQNGSYHLIIATLLAAGFSVLAARAADESRWLRWLLTIWIVENVCLVAFAAQRLIVYIEMYSLTRWRVAALVWLAVVCLGWAWTGWYLVRRRSEAWLIGSNAATVVICLMACCFPNWPRWIAEYNIRHCREFGGQGPRLDIDYLMDLGPQAMPAMYDAMHRLPEGRDRDDARHLLHERWRWQTQIRDNWRSWTLRRAALWRWMAAHPDALNEE